MMTNVTALCTEVLNKVTLILVVYNSAHCVEDLVKDIRSIPNLIVVDNASTDHVEQVIKSQLPHAIYLPQEKNLGFGAANNLALEQVRTPYALLLNPDCAISVQQIAQLIQAADQWPDAALFAPQLLDRRQRVEVNYRWPLHVWSPKCHEPASAPCSTGFVTGAVMLFRMQAMDQVGYFDEHFFLYYEDDDLCTRVFHQQLGIVVLPQIQVVHASRSSVRARSVMAAEYWRGFHHAQSKIKYVHKYEGDVAAKRFKLRVRWMAWVSLPIRLIWPHPKYVARLWGRICGLSQLQ
jgi:N-acetylglucosaminyl-diphospho-decaprenol L-rhamnosyltransferase